ncbi:hypothetical protein BC829DRAFT_386681 [Chytridium lagenaria]|nr:hypothetical protein BC829DRAFT_386681 [Chytridium lagenaria]
MIDQYEDLVERKSGAGEGEGGAFAKLAHALISKLENQLSDVSSSLRDKEEHIRHLTLNANDDDARIRNLQADLEDVLNQNQQMEKVLSSREDALNDIETRVTEMSQELSYLRNQADTLSRKRSMAKIRDLQDAQEAMTRDLCNQVEQTDTLSREKTYAEEDAHQLRMKIRDLQDRLSILTRENKELELRLSAAHVEDVKIQNLQADLEDMSEQKQQVEKELSHLRDHAHTLLVKRTEAKIRDLQDAIEAMTREVLVSPLSPSKPSSLQREIDLLKKEIELKKEEIESIHQDYKQVLSVAEEKVRTYAKLSDSSLQSMELYRDELAKKKEKLEEVQKEHQKLQLQIARSMPITNTPDASMADISSMADALHRAGKTSKTIDELVQSASNKKETTPNFCCGHVVCHKRCTIKDPPSEPEPQPSNGQPVGGDYSLTFGIHAIEALSSQMAEKAHSAETSSASVCFRGRLRSSRKCGRTKTSLLKHKRRTWLQKSLLGSSKSFCGRNTTSWQGSWRIHIVRRLLYARRLSRKMLRGRRLLIEISRLKASFQDKISSSSDTVDDLTRRLQDSERTRESLRRQCSALKEDLRRSQNDLEQARHTLSSLPNDRLERAVSSKIQQLESRINSRESELQQKDSLIRNLEVRLQELFQSNGDILEEGRQRENVLKKEAQARMSEVKELSERLAVLDEGKRVIESHYAHEREIFEAKARADDAVNTALRPATRSTSYEDRLREEIQQLRRELSRARHSTSEIVAVVRETLNQTIGHGDGTSLSSPNRPPRFDISRLREQMGSLISEVIYLRALYQKFYLSLKVEDLLTSQKSTLTFIQEIGINLPSTEPTFTPSATTKLKKCANAIIAVYRMMVLARNGRMCWRRMGRSILQSWRVIAIIGGRMEKCSARKTWSGERRM